MYPSRTVSRRSLLTALGAAGIAVPLLARPAAGAPVAASSAAGMPAALACDPGTAVPPGAPLQLLPDAGLNFAALTILGAAGYGSSEVGEVLTAVATIATAGSSLQSYTDTFLSWGDRLAALSDSSHDRVNVGEYALRAASYYAQALFYVLGTNAPAREEAIYLASRRMWDRWTMIVHPSAQRIDVRVGETSLPVWFFRPNDDRRPRPTLIVNNGSDGQSADMWSLGAAAALQRGWNAVVFEGPGQGETLFVHKIPFSAQWERVVGAIVDRLWHLAGVDRHRIALLGISMGGDLVTRAAAFEHRLAALICAPGDINPWLGFDEGLRDLITPDKDQTNTIWNTQVVPNLSAAERFLVAKRFEPFGATVLDAVRAGQMPTDIWTPSQLVQALDVEAVAHQIQCPTLVLDYDGEQFYPGQPQQLVSLLPSSIVTYRRFTEAEGAQLHCSPMAPRVHSEVVFEWLDKTFGS